ncbi:enoyl-CoA hydratase/isomerase family protein [Novosphingobium album (ex Hu et al. 2023)]|uniref:Enoyl-CoA hydratase/isomerase family protein n=1 Tax=Novosphingobium album (ex Hu et al. 2023) TaxID=2930093 RepID=A0ABT0AY15_9SPHN|nr:enoyl-CoA hydratase/isomerase family protein [Novosphingobium album (ex Hu et al. 2023)]MCJ2177528.1 enoyl-CoA hydratase/isomerase family protein [Novosphingobium album (ex Hu et al. 2023)]
MSEEAPHLLIDDTSEPGIIICTLNRPDKLNAISRDMMDLLTEAVLRLRDTPELKVMLIRSTGRYFSSGADLRSGNQNVVSPVYGSSSARGIRENHRLNLNNMQQLWDEMEHIEKPIVVAHHAMCVGGGLEMSLSCDFRLAAKSAGYAFPEGLFGVLPASGGVSRLTRICGPHWARWLIMANKPAPADMAFTMGLVHQVYEDETFEQEVMDFCRHLAKQNGEQMGAAKVAIELCAEVGRDSSRHVERMANSSLMLNPDFINGMEQYLKGVGGKKK